MDLFVTLVAQPLISAFLLGVIMTVAFLIRDAILFLMRRQFGKMKFQFAVMNWKDGVLHSVERDAFDHPVDMASLYNRYVLMRLMFITMQNKTDTVLTFGKLTDSVMKPIIDYIAPASRDGTFAQIQREPYERLTFWIFVMNDTWSQGKTRVHRVICVLDEDIRNLPEKCSHSSRNFDFVKAAKKALEEDMWSFRTVRIKRPLEAQKKGPA